MDVGFLEGFKIGFGLLWAILMSEPLLTLGVFFILGLAIAIPIVMDICREQKLKESGIREIDQMSGRNFEEYLRVLLGNLGFRVKVTPASGDYGADLVLTTSDQRIIVQAKRYKKNVGIKAVQEIASAKSHYSARMSVGSSPTVSSLSQQRGWRVQITSDWLIVTN
ncbi:restriction endonuclease [Rossellomorea marisflavi]|uniref:restriction endonuclease n=1 Tax=Rossellomorea marisflavi TaxID=189381 RepID=UPI00069DDE9D|nr:restriction endonuclease [Rossellomorea marisflavi]